jgi:hypothetical protein
MSMHPGNQRPQHNPDHTSSLLATSDREEGEGEGEKGEGREKKCEKILTKRENISDLLSRSCELLFLIGSRYVVLLLENQKQFLPSPSPSPSPPSPFVHPSYLKDATYWFY